MSIEPGRIDPERPRVASAQDIGMPTLLLAAVAALLAVVVAVGLVATAPAGLAVIAVLVVALAGLVGVLTVIWRQLGDDEGAPRDAARRRRDR